MRRAVALAAALLLGVGQAEAAPPIDDQAAAAGEEIRSRADEGVASAAELRWLGEVQASSGKRTKALAYWKRAAEAGDPRAPILIADHHFERVWGRGARPAEGVSFTVNGAPPWASVEEAAKWYRLALARDDRTEAKQRAPIGLSMTMGLQATRRLQR